MACSEINAKGGVLGRKIEFTTRDTKFKPDIALSMAKELVMREKVDILAGTINSAAALAISDYSKKEKVPFFVWQSQSERITGEKGHRYVFSVVPNTRIWGKAQAQFEAEQPFTKYWIAGDDYEYGHAIANAVWRNLKELKPEVKLIGESWWKVGEPDLMPYISAILAAEPEAVIFCPGGASMTNVLKVAKATGLSEKIHISLPTAIDHTVISPIGTDAAEAVLGSINYLWYYPDTPANKAFDKAYYNAYGRHPGFSAFSGYTTAYFIAEAVKKAGTVDTEKFIDALEGLEIDSPVGKIKMRAYDHQATLPVFVGVTTKVPKYDFLIATDIVTLPGKEVMPTIEEIKKARGE
jgi:branched-chain amino acid transport system substrate-binding protein